MHDMMQQKGNFNGNSEAQKAIDKNPNLDCTKQVPPGQEQDFFARPGQQAGTATPASDG